MHLFMLLFLSASALGAKLLIVGEHHFDRRYRVAFDQILQADRTVRCVFLEDSPQMDAAAARFLAGGGDFTSVYLARYFEVGAAMGMERADLQSIWDHNYAGRELILASAKRRGLKVYHVDYSSDQSAGFVPLEGDASIQWNYIRRHEIMAENMARHRRECPRAMALVGESHIDVPRVLEMMRRSRGPGFRYTGPPIRSLGAHTTLAGFRTVSAAIAFDPTARVQGVARPVEALSNAELERYTQLEFFASDDSYTEYGVRINLREQFDRLYVFRP